MNLCIHLNQTYMVLIPSNSVLEGLWDVRSNELLNLDIDLFMRRNLLRVEDTLNDVTARQYFRS